MRPNVVLIDFESIQPDSLEALNQDFFFVLVFVGANQKKLPLDIVKALQKLGPRAEYIEISGSGPNALDFHIAYYIGRISRGEPQPYFHIISKDTGFDPLITHIRGMGISIQRITKISEIPMCIGILARTPEERVSAVEAKLKAMSAGRPGTIKSLTGTITALFNKSLSDPEVTDIIQSLEAKGIITIDKTKVVYPTPL